jgi:hypothetical protein
MVPTFGVTIRTASIVLGSLLWGDLAPGQPGPRPRPPVSPIIEICWVDRWQPAECISVKQLRQVLTESQVDKLLASLNNIGVDAAHDALVECGRAPRPVVASITPGTGPSKPVSPTTASLTSLSGRVSQCAERIAEYSGSLAGARGGAGWIDSAVAQAGFDFSSCRDSGNSPISADANERRVKGVMDMSTPAPPPAASTAGSSSVEDSALFVKKGHDPAPPDGDKKAIATWLWLKANMLGLPMSPCREGANCTPTCDQKQARWQSLKESCEQSDWKAYPCVDFLRKVNGCVDASLINPGPDGDLTCPKLATPAHRMRTAWEHNCSRRQMFVVPVPGGGDICKRPEEAMPVSFDICNDPQAMPSEDQCIGPSRGSGPDRPSPTPEPDPRSPSIRPPG